RGFPPLSGALRPASVSCGPHLSSPPVTKRRKRADPTFERQDKMAQKTPGSALGNGGETQQRGGAALTTNHGIPFSDNQISLRAGDRDPTLLEDFLLREK